MVRIYLVFPLHKLESANSIQIGKQVSVNDPPSQEGDMTAPRTSPTAEGGQGESLAERDEATYDQLFGGADDEEEFDNELQAPEEAGFDRGDVLEWYQDHLKSGSETDDYVVNHPVSQQQQHHPNDDGTGEAESYGEASIQDGGLTTWKAQDADSDDEDIDNFNYTEDIYRGDHSEEAGVIGRAVEYKHEEGGAPFDPSAANAVTHSPLSSDEEELIDYEDDQDEQPPAQLQTMATANENDSTSPTSLKRFRENSDDQEQDEDEDEAGKNQGWLWRSHTAWTFDNNLGPAPKRVRAE